ncbi:hypothetical protein ABW21_db0208881 [Orbilia brochopaga]|nr:hypothetical protein ABW21_db0208881 [Drechslerella brochopaga]
MASRVVSSPSAPSRPQKGDVCENTTHSTQSDDNDSRDDADVISLREALGYVLAAVVCVLAIFALLAPHELTHSLVTSAISKCNPKKYFSSSKSPRPTPPKTYISIKHNLCSTYASQIFEPTDRTTHIQAQAAFVKTILDVAFLGNYSTYTHPADMGILRSGRYNGHSVDVLPFFNGAYVSSNRDNEPAAVNFLDAMTGTCKGYKSHFKRSKDVDISPFTPAGCPNARRYARTSQGRMRTQMERYLAKILRCDIAPPLLPAYDGRGLREAHKFMAVTDAELGYFVRQIEHAMIYIGVSPADSHAVGRTLRVDFEAQVSTFENAKAEWRPMERPRKGKPIGPNGKKIAAQITTAMVMEFVKRQIDVGFSEPGLINSDGGGDIFASFSPTPTPFDTPSPTPFDTPFDTPSPSPTPFDTPFETSTYTPFDTPFDTSFETPFDTTTSFDAGPETPPPDFITSTTSRPTTTSSRTSTTSSSPQTSEASSSNNVLPAAIGGGVGGGLGVVLIAGVAAFFFIRHRRQQRSASDMYPTMPAAPTAPTQYGPMSITPVGLDGQEIGGIQDAESGYGGIQGEQPGSRRPTPFFS